MADPEDGKSPDTSGAEKGRNSDLADFGARLRKTQQAHLKPASGGGRGTAMGIAFRLVTELVAGVFVGAAIGWVLDSWLGTRPWFLLVFFFIGAAAGILNVYRAARQIAASAERDAGGDQQG
ncbi:AtpZ/AtpI family protein [Parvibaculum sp.]|uniref:AtpZ/AtpI family protein n=1 Tax=Parvibaculum sp. TaxID=2024848 RepID=UPI0034A0870B